MSYIILTTVMYFAGDYKVSSEVVNVTMERCKDFAAEISYDNGEGVQTSAWCSVLVIR